MAGICDLADLSILSSPKNLSDARDLSFFFFFF